MIGIENFSLSRDHWPIEKEIARKSARLVIHSSNDLCWPAVGDPAAIDRGDWCLDVPVLYRLLWGRHGARLPIARARAARTGPLRAVAARVFARVRPLPRHHVLWHFVPVSRHPEPFRCPGTLPQNRSRRQNGATKACVNCESRESTRFKTQHQSSSSGWISAWAFSKLKLKFKFGFTRYQNKKRCFRDLLQIRTIEKINFVLLASVERPSTLEILFSCTFVRLNWMSSDMGTRSTFRTACVSSTTWSARCRSCPWTTRRTCLTTTMRTRHAKRCATSAPPSSATSRSISPGRSASFPYLPYFSLPWFNPIHSRCFIGWSECSSTERIFNPVATL